MLLTACLYEYYINFHIGVSMCIYVRRETKIQLTIKEATSNEKVWYHHFKWPHLKPTSIPVEWQQSLVTIQELAISPLVYPCLAKLPLNIFQVLRFLLYLTDWTASKVQKQYEKTIQRPRLGQQYGGSMHGCILANRSKTHCGTKIN